MIKRNTLDRTLKNNTKRPFVNLSTFSFLFSEIIQYFLSKNTQTLESDLSNIGKQMAPRILELLSFRSVKTRYIKHLEILKFINGPVWKSLFGK